ncbi:unnamed protein product, partial [Polarella glacialis]
LAEAQQTELALTWQKPLDDGGLAVNRYLLEVVREDRLERFVEAVSTMTSMSVDGLQGNTNYLLRLRAETAAGQSPAAELLASTAPVPPGVAGLPRLLSATSTAATLSWSAPSENGGAE